MQKGMQEGVQELLNAAGTCAIVPAAAFVTRADGHAYGGKGCLRILQEVSGTRSHLRVGTEATL